MISLIILVCLCTTVMQSRDPSTNVVLLEDAAAVLGVALAAGCMGLTSLTGISNKHKNSTWPSCFMLTVVYHRVRVNKHKGLSFIPFVKSSWCSFKLCKYSSKHTSVHTQSQHLRLPRSLFLLPCGFHGFVGNVCKDLDNALFSKPAFMLENSPDGSFSSVCYLALTTVVCYWSVINHETNSNVILYSWALKEKNSTFVCTTRGLYCGIEDCAYQFT